MVLFEVETVLSSAKHLLLGKEKVLLISDIHAPFHREQMIIDIILKHRHEVQTIIFVGDIIDCEAVSKYPKEIRRPLVEEMAITYKFLARIDRLTPNVKKILVWGNHEYRFVRYLAEHPNPLNPLHSDNILANIVSGFTHHDRLSKKKTIYPPLSSNFKVVNKWFFQYHDLVVAHPIKFSSIQLRTAIRAVEHFLKRGFLFRTLYIGHTHKWGETTHYGIRVGELGCTCENMDYADTGNTDYSPQDYGYAVVAFDNGITDNELTRLYRVLVTEEGEEVWEENQVNLTDQS